MPAPAWGLTIVYWLHMLATVVWIGGLASLALLVLPAAGNLLDGAAYATFLEKLQRRFDPLSWFCLLMLVGTGMFQMSASPNYQGFLAVDNTWALAILLKHLAFFAMVAVSAWGTWGILPDLRRGVLRISAGKAPEQATAEIQRLQARSLFLLRLNLALSFIVLAFTALARVS